MPGYHLCLYGRYAPNTIGSALFSLDDCTSAIYTTLRRQAVYLSICAPVVQDRVLQKRCGPFGSKTMQDTTPRCRKNARAKLRQIGILSLRQRLNSADTADLQCCPFEINRLSWVVHVSPCGGSTLRKITPLHSGMCRYDVTSIHNCAGTSTCAILCLCDPPVLRVQAVASKDQMIYVVPKVQ